MGNSIIPGKSETTPLAKRNDDIFDIMRREIDQVFNRWGSAPPSWPFGVGVPRELGGVVPHMDVTETDKELRVEAELPGVDEKDVSVTLQDGVLTLRGEKKAERDEKKENYHVAERSFGSFTRQLRLPDIVDESKIEAKFQNGVLQIAVPKRAEAVKPQRTIEIKTR